jgi:threonine/homoserine/homoserine lactone efflux protein
MTVYSALISFAVVAGLLTIIPGIDSALVVRAAVSQGRRAGFVTALGIGSGTLVWGAAAAIGVSALLTASRLGYDVLRLAGAGYLLTLGATMLCQSCVVSSTVEPSLTRLRTTSNMSSRLAGSRPVVGSSRKITCGLPTSDAARSRRRRMPPE